MRFFRCLMGLVALAVGCGSESVAEKTEVPAGGKGDAWNAYNAPQLFEIPLQTTFDTLPAEGRVARMPWAETYWPTTQDSYNVRWDGPRELSPLEKYDVAFNGWVPPEGFFELRPLTKSNCASGAWDPEYYEALGPAAKHWSENFGNGRARNGFDEDLDGQIDECGDFDGMQGWWGSCHAWAPAAMLEAEPLDPVEINAVTFYPSDVKALITMLYEESRQVAIGGRCQLDLPERDEFGRIGDPDCRNTNAGAFHLLLGNLIGLREMPFGEDRIAGEQVWNQPLAGYRVTRQQEVDEAQALALLGRPEERYPFNDDAERFVEIEVDVDYVFESHASRAPSTPNIEDHIRTDDYHYVLELDAEGQILGGEWISNVSQWSWSGSADRPDTVSLTMGPGRLKSPHVRISDIRELQRRSRPETRDVVVRAFVDEPRERIPDWPAAPLKRTIEVPDDVIPSDVVVELNIVHDWIFDLQVTLVRDEKRILLFDRNPRGSSTSFSGRIPVPQLAGENAQGAWTLEVWDRAGRAIGRLFEWSIELTAQGEGEPGPAPEPVEERIYSPAGGTLEIPDFDPAGVESSLRITEHFDTTYVIAHVDIEHPYRGDLRVSLERNGVRMVLHERRGDQQDDLLLEVDVSHLASGDVFGEWKLVVQDLANLDVGILRGWSLRMLPRPTQET